MMNKTQRKMVREFMGFLKDEDNHICYCNQTDRGFVETKLHSDDFRQIQQLTEGKGEGYTDFFDELSQHVMNVVEYDTDEMSVELVKILNQLKHPMSYQPSRFRGLVGLMRQPRNEFGCRFTFVVME